MSKEGLDAGAEGAGNEIAIVGMTGRFPGASDIEELWHNLRSGIESVSFFTDEELLAAGVEPAMLADPSYVRARCIMPGIEEFDAPFFGYSALEAEATDPQQRIFLECCWQALEQAGYDSERYRRPVGVFAGVGPNAYGFHVFANRTLIGALGEFQAILGNDKDYLATRVSYKLDLTGPSLVVQTACSTSLVAVHLACQALLAGECDLALAGGVAVKLPQARGYLYREGGINSPDGHCRAFDARAQGTISGTGAGVVVLKRLADALDERDHVLAVIRGSAVNNDGAYKIGYTAPSVEGQAKVIRMAQAMAGVDPATITYVEAHGTATPLGDPIEIAALTEAFRSAGCSARGFCAVGSIKTNIGHLDTAAGVAGLIKTVLALHHKEIPPSLHFEVPNPKIAFAESPFYVNAALAPWQTNGAPRRAGVSSFGIGGTNAHVVLEEAPPAQLPTPSRRHQLLMLTARTAAALERATANLADHLERREHASLADVAFTLQIGRRRFPHRRFALVEDASGAVAALRAQDPARVWSRVSGATSRPVVFLFPGQGSQYVGMGRGLYESEPAFREGIDRCAELLAPLLDVDLRDVLYPPGGETAEAEARLRRSELAQPALFAVEHSLAGLWREWGIRPVAMVGHSVGELVAATLAGVFSLEDALRLTALRGRLVQRQPPGAMLAVPLEEEELRRRLPPDQGLALAAVNGPALCVVSGPTEAIGALEAELAASGISCRRLHTSHAFHSAMMEPAVSPFVEAVAGVRLGSPRVPFASNVTGGMIAAEEATSPAYWGRHLRETVRFGDCLDVVTQEPERILLEVGPGKTLSTLARQHSRIAPQAVAIPCLRHPQEPGEDSALLLTALGRLWLAGAAVDWNGFYRREQRRRRPLPTYPFERQRYCVDLLAPVKSETERSPQLDAAPLQPEHAGASTAESKPPGGHARPDLETAYAAPSSAEERRIVEIWEGLLGIEQVGVNDDFFELGGHSLLAIQVVARLREAMGVEIPLQDLLAHPTVAGVAERIAERAKAIRSGSSVEGGLARLTPDPDRWSEPFPLTDLQQAYWIGRSADVALGGVSTHIYLEIDCVGLDLGRLNRGLVRLIEHHGMLRGIVMADGMQRILPEVPAYRIGTLDLRGIEEDGVRLGLEQVRRRMSHQVLPSDRWPLFEVRASLLGESRVRLHVSFDFLIGDAWSWQLLLGDLVRLYRDPEVTLPELTISFRDYVLAEVAFQESDLYRAALGYWQERLAELPGPPELPLVGPAGLSEGSRFTRRRASLEKDAWNRLKARASQRSLTPSGVLLAAFCEALAAWSKSPRFTLNLTLFNRLPRHPEVNRLVGDFTSLLLLAFDGSAGGRFEDRARLVQGRLWEALEHRYVSGVRILRELARVRGSGPVPVLPVVFTSVLNLDAGTGTEGLLPEDLPRSEVVYGISQTPQVLLDHQVSESAGALFYNWDAVDAAFPPGLLDDMFGTYKTLLERLAAGEDAWLERAPLAPPVPFPGPVLMSFPSRPQAGARLESLFERQVERHADRPAVIGPDRVLTYAELDRRSRRLAGRLSQLGAGRDRLVAVVMEKGWEQVVAVLAIVRAGAAYLPVDAGLPAERLQRLLAESEVAITQLRLEQTLDWPEGIVRLSVAADEEHGTPELPRVERQPEDLAYVLFTSGSTGTPKGVMIEHGAAVNTVLDINQRFGIGPGDRVLGLSALSFDLSVYDIFGPLAAGGALVLPDPWAAREPARWAELLESQRVTVWNSVPALMDMLIEHLSRRGQQLPALLRLVLLSGDWIPVGLPDRLRAAAPGGVQVVSLGGATEAAIWSVLYPIGNVDPAWPSIPYGRAMENQQLHVLDGQLEPRPVWAVGDLYIGGLGLARGYWKDETKTDAAFVRHPRTGQRLYRTGDLGRWLPDGNIEFLGREDAQVKVRGFRIELGEIEAVLAQHPAVVACAVTAAGERVRQQLVAYVVPADPGSALESEQLKDFLGARLPAYMVPAAFVSLAALPLTANGKVDRAALPAPDLPPERSFVPPSTPTARVLAEIWRDILAIERVGLGDSFFELGGQSLLATRLAARVRESFGLEIPLRTLFEAPTLAELADRIERELEKGVQYEIPPLSRIPSAGRVPLSFAQQRLWFMEQLSPGGAAYNISAAVMLSGELSFAALAYSLESLVLRHEVLRTGIGTEDGQPLGIVSPPSPLPLPLVDLADLPGWARERESRRLAAAEAGRPFDLSNPSLLRACLLRRQASEHMLLLSLHHIAGDAWSMGILVEEMAAAYGAAVSGRPAALADLPIQYGDFARWQREWLQGERLDRALAYWRTQLAGCPPRLDLAGRRLGRASGDRRGAQHSQALPSALAHALRDLSRREGVTLFMTLLAGFQALLSRLSGQEDIVVGADTAGRVWPQTERLIGFFINMLVLRTDLSANPTFRELLARARRVALAAYAHQDVPFEKVVEAVQPERSTDHSPLFQVVFNFTSLTELGAGREKIVLPGLSLALMEPEDMVARFDLSLMVTEVGEVIHCAWVYDTGLFDGSEIERMHGRFVTLLTHAAAAPEVPLDELQLLTLAESQEQQLARRAREESKRRKLLAMRPGATESRTAGGGSAK